jgi:hypothetical protein
MRLPLFSAVRTQCFARCFRAGCRKPQSGLLMEFAPQAMLAYRKLQPVLAGVAAHSFSRHGLPLFRQNALNVSRAVVGPGDGRKSGYVPEKVWKSSPLHSFHIRRRTVKLPSVNQWMKTIILNNGRSYRC